jgi:ABC-2 type transport system ATP-binding protein
LDIPSKRQFRRMISDAMNDKTCIIISTHQVSDLDDLIDQLIIMDQHEIVFKESIENITSKLLFKTTENNEFDEQTLYSEQTPNGYNQIRKNTAGEENKLDIELLFNAILSDKQNIKELLNSASN